MYFCVPVRCPRYLETTLWEIRENWDQGLLQQVWLILSRKNSDTTSMLFLLNTFIYLNLYFWICVIQENLVVFRVSDRHFTTVSSEHAKALHFPSLPSFNFPWHFLAPKNKINILVVHITFPDTTPSKGLETSLHHSPAGCSNHNPNTVWDFS